MSSGYGLLVRFHLSPGGAAGFDRLVAETVPEITKHEPGTLIYIVHDVQDHPDQRVFYELYADKAAFDTHEQQPYIRSFLKERDQYLTSFDVDYITPTLSNKGL